MNLKVISCQTAVALSLVTFMQASHADFLSDLFSSNTKEPVALNASTAEITSWGPMWVIDGRKASAWQITHDKKNSSKNYTLHKTSGDLNLINSQINAGSIARTTGKVFLEKPTAIEQQPNGTLRVFYGNAKNPVVVNVRLQAYNISGLKIANYLKNRDGSTSAYADGVGSKTFPEGSLAYKVETTFENDEMVLPINEKFTSAKSNKELIKNFSDIPFCLNRTVGHSYGIAFNPSQVGAKSGTFSVIPVKRDTMFCQPTGERAVASGTWNAITTGKSSAIVLNMPPQVDPSEYGIESHETGVSRFAFVAPSKGDHVFRPGQYYAKGTTVRGQRFLFNETAASAAMNALGAN